MIDFRNDEEITPMKEDKILNNSYNSGDIDYEAFTAPMKIDDRVSSLYDDQLSENLIDVRTEKALDEDLYKLFQESPFYAKYKNPKRVERAICPKCITILRRNWFEEKAIPACKFLSLLLNFFKLIMINYMLR